MYFCVYLVHEYGGCHLATTNIEGNILVDVSEIHLACNSYKGRIWIEAFKLYFEKKDFLCYVESYWSLFGFPFCI